MSRSASTRKVHVVGRRPGRTGCGIPLDRALVGDVTCLRCPRPCVALVRLDLTRCPSCGTGIDVQVWAQPTLFYFGGEGQTTAYVRRRCPGCGWTLPSDVYSLNPRHNRLPSRVVAGETLCP